MSFELIITLEGLSGSNWDTEQLKKIREKKIIIDDIAADRWMNGFFLFTRRVIFKLQFFALKKIIMTKRNIFEWWLF